MTREYSPEEQKELQANQYTYKVTKKRLFFTAAFKREFWNNYQAGIRPRKILTDLGYNEKMFPQKQIDNMVQHIRKEAQDGEFREGHQRRPRSNAADTAISQTMEPTPENMQRIWNELQYVRQEVEFIKKLQPTAKGKQVTT